MVLVPVLPCLAQSDSSSNSIKTDTFTSSTELINSDSLQTNNSGITTDTTQRGKKLILKILFPPKRPPFDPEIAWIRSAILPGWGQWYNKSYWKLPFVYGAYGGMVYLVWFNNNEYTRFRSAFRLRTDGDDTTNPTDIPDNVSDESIRTARDAARRNRDLAILGVLVVHVLQVVEAYVDAHLKDFDVSDDLAINIKPALSSQSMAFSSSLFAGAQLTLTF